MSFKLKWENSLESQFQTIYRANEPFEFDRLPNVYATVDKGVTEFTDTAIEQFAPYYYRVASNRELKGQSEQVVSQLVSGGPSLNLDFAGQSFSVMQPSGAMSAKPFSEIVTFTRSSGGGRFNSSGVYEWLGNNVPRLDYDPVTLQPLGILIEEARTNLIPYSDTSGGGWVGGGSVVRNVSTGLPSPFSVAATLERSASQLTFNYYQQLTPTAGTTYTFSVFVAYEDGRDVAAEFGAPGTENSLLNPFSFVANDALFTWASISKTPVARGGYRLSMTITTSDSIARGWGVVIRTTHKSVASKLLVTGYMIEVGAFPTSYIPTEASQVTRAADIASVNELSPWYNPSEGALFLEAVPGQTVTANWAAALSNSSTGLSNLIDLGWQGGAAGARGRVVNNGVTQAEHIFGPGVSVGDPIKIAIAFAANSVQTAARGVVSTKDTSAVIPVVDRLQIGRAAQYGYSPGHIKSIRYFPRALSSSELQAITS